MQSLTTGMQSLIAETGSVGDSYRFWGKAVKDWAQHWKTGKYADADQEWFMRKTLDQGYRGMVQWHDVVDLDREMVMRSGRSSGLAKKALGVAEYGSRKVNTFFQRYNDDIGLLAGFQIGRSKGMALDEAYNYALGVKERGMFTGGKAQRSVGLFGIKTKAVPQLMNALNTYTLGWFSQMGANWKIGWGKAPGDFSAQQRTGARKAFIYGLAAQATLAGALGLPGVGQGLALIQQATGEDPKGWLRQNLAKLFDEDQESGGMLTSLALRGGLNAITPIDPSNRAAISFPFTGVDPYKGFNISSLGGAVGTTVSDWVQGLLGSMRGDAQALLKLLPSVAKGPVQLLQGEGDVRDERGTLLQTLSPAERFLQGIGIPSSRVQTAKDTAESGKRMIESQQRGRQKQVDELATLTRNKKIPEVKAKLAELKSADPTLDLQSLVRSIASRVEAQSVPYDWRRSLPNPAADLAGLTDRRPSTEALRRQVRQGVVQQLGGRPSFDPLADREAAMVDQLLDSDWTLTPAEAKKRVRESLRGPGRYGL